MDISDVGFVTDSVPPALWTPPHELLIDISKATKGSKQFKRSYDCVVCHLTFREDQVTMFRGKPYGIPCGCSKDIAQLISRGK